LDGVTVHWNADCLSWEDEHGDYAFEHVGVIASDLDETFAISHERTPLHSGEIGLDLPTSDTTGPAALTYSTGAPGRRTSTHLVEAEMRRRFATGKQAPSLQAEAEHLSQWLRAAHPEAASMTAKTIQNRLGALYRQLKAQIPK
jgi:hypothetical protein